MFKPEDNIFKVDLIQRKGICFIIGGYTSELPSSVTTMFNDPNLKDQK